MGRERRETTRDGMSERGSFVTQYCQCGKCFLALERHLLDQDKFLCSEVLKWRESGEKLPIIAGKIGGNHSGQESISFWYVFGHKIAKEICHPVRIAILCDDPRYDEIFVIEPGQTEEKTVRKYDRYLYNGEGNEPIKKEVEA